MSGDVAKTVKTGTGVEGSAYICPNGLKIVPSPPQRVNSQINTPLSDTALSGVYEKRYDDPTYYG